MKQIINFRPLAYNVKNKQGQQIKNIYRGGLSQSITDDDAQMLKDKKIKHIIDLRGTSEIQTAPMINESGIKTKNIMILKVDQQNKQENFGKGNFENLMIELYQNQFVKSDGFAEELAYIHQLQGETLMFHCTAGKDRTGITGVILMYILGFTKSQIIDEYLAIDPKLEIMLLEKIKRIPEFNTSNIPKATLLALVSVNEKYLEAFFTGVEQEYQTFDNYIEKKIGLTQKMQADLKKYYLN